MNAGILFKRCVWLMFLTVIVSMQPASFGETIDTAIKRELETIRAYNSGQTDAIGSPNDKVRTLQALISELINGVYKMDAGDGAAPSPQRQALIDRFASLIAPYNADLVKIGFSRDRALMELAHQCRSLLDHTKPDEVFAAELRSYTDGLNSNAGYAYDLLFQHRLLTRAEKSDLAQKVLAEPDRETRIRWAMKCSAMLMPEVVPVLREMLDAPFTAEGTIGNTGVFGENEALTNYRRVIEAINYLGPSASSLLPLLRERLREVEAALPPDQAAIYSAQFRNAIAQAEGKAPLRIPTAISGSGLLVSSPQAKNAATPAPPVATPTRATPVPTAKPVASPAPTTSVAQTPAAVVERRSPAWPWVVGIAALVVIVALIFKRRA